MPGRVKLRFGRKLAVQKRMRHKELRASTGATRIGRAAANQPAYCKPYVDVLDFLLIKVREGVFWPYAI